MKLLGRARDADAAAAAASRAATLSPIRRIDWAVGPTKISPAASTAAANSEFSARNPYPGWMASAPVAFAAARIASRLRYDFDACAGPMSTHSSASRTASESLSALL
jgi:hypothetical protein